MHMNQLQELEPSTEQGAPVPLRYPTYGPSKAITTAKHN